MRGRSRKCSGGGAVADSVYPVGAIYLSTSATDPATLFGGTWERIQDRFLLCAGTTYAAGSTGGEASHKLTVEEMPSHRHTSSVHKEAYGTYVSAGGEEVALAATKQTNTGYAGGGSAHNNMPPYLAVYAWRRTA